MSNEPETTSSIHHDGSGDVEDPNLNYICPSLSLSCPGGVGPLGCRYKYHYRTPYHWQLIFQPSPASAATTIVDIDDDQTSKDIEKQFSNPDTTQAIVQFNNRVLTIDFNTMTAISEPVHGQGSGILYTIFGSFFTAPSKGTATYPDYITIKRLSTLPNIILHKQPNTTEWLWYWQNDDETVNWSQMSYTETTSDDQISPCGTLERLYHQSIMNPAQPIIKKFTIPGKRRSFTISINFNKLTMTLHDDGLDYPLRRRPATFNTFVDWCYLQISTATTGCTGLTWVTFGDLSPEGDTRYPVTAEELESQYISQSDLTFTHGAYTIDLNKNVMHLSSRRDGNHSVNIRRDAFKSNQLIPLQNYPATWDPMPQARIFVTITVPEFTSEFKKVQNVVTASRLLCHHTPYKLTRLRRIQNPASYNSFIQNKALLEKTFPNIAVREETLYHGTNALNIKLICEMNFDPKLAGTVNGAVFGKGTYFAKNPMYSIGFCRNNADVESKNVLKLFVYRVLVGPSALGGFGLLGPKDELVTLVDNWFSPSIFVNRRNHSFYPEYIAELSH